VTLSSNVKEALTLLQLLGLPFAKEKHKN